MKLLVLIPRVINNYLAQFPEVRNNAYKYFNYDNRVVDERVDRHDQKPIYKNPDDFSNTDYNELITYAKTLINSILLKYSKRIACEDALHQAIWSFKNGAFRSKVNAGRFNVLLKTLQESLVPSIPITVMSKKEKPKKEKPLVVKPHTLKQLGIKPKDVPLCQRVHQRQPGVPVIVREKGRIIKK
jgi:hypothetical protein